MGGSTSSNRRSFRKASGWLATHQPRVLEMILVAALAGLRWDELVGLRVAEDVDFKRNRIRGDPLALQPHPPDPEEPAEHRGCGHDPDRATHPPVEEGGVSLLEGRGTYRERDLGEKTVEEGPGRGGDPAAHLMARPPALVRCPAHARGGG